MVFKGTLEDARVAVLDLGSRQWTILIDRPGHAPTVTPTGELLYLRGSVLTMVPFDRARRAITGTPEPVLTGVAFNNGGAGHYAVSHTGVLTYVSEFDTLPQTAAYWAMRRGETRQTGLPEDTYSEPALSPDGGRLALLVQERTGRSKIAVWDFARATFSAQLQADAPRESPIWSADGTSLGFTSRPKGAGSAGGLFRQRADETSGAEPLSADVPGQTHGRDGLLPASVSADGQRLFLQQAFPRPMASGS